MGSATQTEGKLFEKILSSITFPMRYRFDIKFPLTYRSNFILALRKDSEKETLRNTHEISSYSKLCDVL